MHIWITKLDVVEDGSQGPLSVSSPRMVPWWTITGDPTCMFLGTLRMGTPLVYSGCRHRGLDDNTLVRREASSLRVVPRVRWEVCSCWLCDVDIYIDIDRDHGVGSDGWQPVHRPTKRLRSAHTFMLTLTLTLGRDSSVCWRRFCGGSLRVSSC